jgi:polar amino acid transport system substrate-binding protein
MNRLLIAMTAGIFVAGATGATAQDSYKIATEGAYPPFNFVDPSGALQGFEVDLGNALCEKMNSKCQFVIQDFDGTIPGILAGKYDFALTSMSITPERQKTVDFSEKYYSTAAVFTAPKDTTITDISPAGLAGKTVGAQSSTIHAAMLEDKYKDVEIRMYPTLDEALRDLASGRVSTVFGDKLATAPWLKSQDGSCCKIVGGDIKDVSFGPGVGAPLKKGNDALRTKLNTAIKAIVEDGTYKKINDKYFPFNIY